MSIENEPSDEELLLRLLDRCAPMTDHYRVLSALNDAVSLGHARGVVDERTRSAIELAEVKQQADYITDALAEQVDALKAELEHWVVSGQSAELSILRAEKARREGERGPVPSEATLTAQCFGCTSGEPLTKAFRMGAWWGEQGRPEQPPRGPRPPNPYSVEMPYGKLNSREMWELCAAAYEAWMVSGREGPSEAAIDKIEILNSNVCALILLLTYDGQRTRADGSVLTGETLEGYRERTAREGFDEATNNRFEILNSNVCSLIELLTYDGAKTRAEETVLAGETASEYQDRTSKPKT